MTENVNKKYSELFKALKNNYIISNADRSVRLLDCQREC